MHFKVIDVFFKSPYEIGIIVTLLSRISFFFHGTVLANEGVPVP